MSNEKQKNPSRLRVDSGKPFMKRTFDKVGKELKKRQETAASKTTEISEADAKRAHQISSDLGRQMDRVTEQILSKLHAILEIQGIEHFLKNPASKIVFNVEISRVNDQLYNVVQHVIEVD